MRSEIVKRDEKIRILSKKAGARFVPFEVYSPDKMQFITDELQRSNIQFVEESNTLYIPDWATKTAALSLQSTSSRVSQPEYMTR